VAFALLPQTAEALREIREAQAARGHRLRGGRDLLPIVVPVLASGLERAVTLSEALESRGFGAALAHRDARWRGFALAVGAAAAMVAVYALAVGRPGFAAATGAVGAGTLLLLAWGREEATRTRYRETRWRTRERVVAAGAAIAIVATLATLELDPAGLRYEPYPRLTLPRVDLALMVALLALLAPVFVAPAPGKRVDAP
jgi:energy-coupling factor transport system permease protein